MAVAANASPVTNSTVAGGGELNAGNSDDDPTTIIQVADLIIDKSHVGDFTQETRDRATPASRTSARPGNRYGDYRLVPAGLTPTAANNGTINGWNVSFTGQTVTARADALAAAGRTRPATHR